MRLAFFAAAVHQLVITLVSKMPFAVAQLQDVGVLILAQMAHNIAADAPEGTTTS